MKVLLNVSLERLEKNVNRQILVDEAIRLDDLCEGIIISFGGNLIPCYDIECDNKQYGYEELEKKYLNDFKLKKNKNIKLLYNLYKYYIFNINIDNIYASDTFDYFEVQSGCGEISDQISSFELKDIYEFPDDYLKKSQKELKYRNFDYLTNREIVSRYLEEKKLEINHNIIYLMCH